MDIAPLVLAPELPPLDTAIALIKKAGDDIAGGADIDSRVTKVCADLALIPIAGPAAAADLRNCEGLPLEMRPAVVVVFRAIAHDLGSVVIHRASLAGKQPDPPAA